MNMLIQQVGIKLIENVSNDVCIAKKNLFQIDFSFELCIHQRILKIFIYCCFLKKMCWAPNQHIRMISEESCDTEDWSKDAEKSNLTLQE